MTCICDLDTFAPILDLAAGLDDLPRQLGGFPEFREAMLALVPTYGALANWRGRDDQDLGLMLVEMWAYVCDVVSFYDKVIADEAYVRTAKQRASIRKLVSLLGYVPRPAVSAQVRLSLLAGGKTPVIVPAGTAFRSGAFPGGAPQIFQLDADTTIYPDANTWKVAPSAPPALDGTVASLYLEAATAKVVDGDLVLLELGADAYVRTVAKVSRLSDLDARALVQVDLDVPVVLAAPVALADAHLLKPARSAELHRTQGNDLISYAPSAAILEGLHPSIKLDHRLVITDDVAAVAARVTKPYELDMIVRGESTFTVDSKDIVTPAIKAPMTVLEFDATGPEAVPAWTDADARNLTVYYHFVSAGRLTSLTRPLLEAGAPLVLRHVHVGAGEPPALGAFQLVDAEARGVDVTGGIDWAAGTITPTSEAWTPGLLLPVIAHGNVATATRGETVTSERLGSGDGSATNQVFTLAKAPLSYVASPTADNDAGVASTLTVWVDGVAWREVASFYDAGPADRVYLVRQTDSGASEVRFGDGVQGARLPTGAGNVLASYRYGAGKAAPPPGSITRIARGALGLRGVADPVGAFGGDDAEPASQLRTLAPRSALLLGRAVSIDDMVVAASAAPGVISAAAEWRWDGVRQAPVIKVWFLGDAALAPSIAQRLRAISDPSTPIEAAAATALTPTLAIDVETDPAYLADDVTVAVRDALLEVDTGLLPPERIGIGQPVFRSALFAAVLAVPGTVAVRAALWDGAPFLIYGRTPGAGAYFQFSTTNLTVTGSPS